MQSLPSSLLPTELPGRGCGGREWGFNGPELSLKCAGVNRCSNLTESPMLQMRKLGPKARCSGFQSIRTLGLGPEMPDFSPVPGALRGHFFLGFHFGFLGVGWVLRSVTKVLGSLHFVPCSARASEELLEPAPARRCRPRHCHQHPAQQRPWQACACQQPAARGAPLPASRGASALPPARTEAATKERSAVACGGSDQCEPTAGCRARRGKPPSPPRSRSAAAPQYAPTR